MEQTSTLAGGTWTTSALYLKAGSGCSAQIIRRNGEYHHADIFNSFPVVSNNAAQITGSNVYDAFGVQQYTTGNAAGWWQYGTTTEDGLLFMNGRIGIPGRGGPFNPLEPIFKLGCIACIATFFIGAVLWLRECDLHAAPQRSPRWYACLRNLYEAFKEECEKKPSCAKSLELCKEACVESLPKPTPKPIPELPRPFASTATT